MPALGRRRFDYSVPERWQAQVVVGSRVRLLLHGRRVGGWVTAVGVEPPEGVRLQAITGVSGHGPPPAVLELAEWAAWRWAVPVPTLLRTASPERNVTALPPAPPPAASAAAARADSGAGAPGAWRKTVLVRRPPAMDLLPLVLDVVGGADGASVVVLVPSTGWASRLAERLRRRGVAATQDWAEAAAGWPVVVGSRSAAWAPVPRLAAAVVLDAHDHASRFDAAEVVAERAERAGAPCVLVSPCPTAVQVARHGPVQVPDPAAERAGWPVLWTVDRRGADPRTGLLSDELVALARRVTPGLLVCVLNRTGRARLLACAACGELARCERCGRTVEEAGAGLRCRGCGAERPVVCASCGAMRLKVLRQGVSRVREELEALLGVAVGEVWGPAGRSGAAEPVPGTPVLVGTEAVLHRVRRAAAVAFLDFDQHLLAPRYGAAEEALGLLARAGRLVGGRRGTVLVQTRLPGHEVLQAASSGDPGRLTELPVRRGLGLPPFGALAVVRAETAPELGGVEVSAIGGGRWLVRAPDHRVLCDALSPLHGGVTVDPSDV